MYQVCKYIRLYTHRLYYHGCITQRLRKGSSENASIITVKIGELRIPFGYFYLVTAGWIFDISLLLCENSINQSINHYDVLRCALSRGSDDCLSNNRGYDIISEADQT